MIELVLSSLLLAAASTRPAAPGGWTTGSTGALGDVVYGPGQHVIDFAVEGVYDPVAWRVVFDYQSLTIQSGATVTFANHPSRAPVVMRALGEVVIDGTLRLDGADGHSTVPPSWAEPGPGGFQGGQGNHLVYWNGSGGHGPGGGFAGEYLNGSGGSHATAGAADSIGAAPGTPYGSPAVLPLIGGSGGGGGDRNEFMLNGGAAGGGALLVGSDTRIRLNGFVTANGGSSSINGPYNGGAGSGGALRFVAPEIVQGGGQVSARGGLGGTFNWYRGGDGRIRLEMDGDLGTPWIADPAPSLAFTLGEFLPALPSLSLASWWDAATGQWVPIDPDPHATIRPPAQADVQLPEEGLVTVRLEGRDVPIAAPLFVRVTDTGGVAIVDATHAMGEVAGSTLALSWTDVAIDFSQGVTAVQVRAELP